MAEDEEPDVNFASNAYSVEQLAASNRRRSRRLEPHTYLLLPNHRRAKYSPVYDGAYAVYHSNLARQCPFVVEKVGWECLYRNNPYIPRQIIAHHNNEVITWSEALYEVHLSIQVASWLQQFTEELYELHGYSDTPEGKELNSRIPDLICSVFGKPPSIRYNQTCENCYPIMKYREFDIYFCTNHMSNSDPEGEEFLTAYQFIFRFGEDTARSKKYYRKTCSVSNMCEWLSCFGTKGKPLIDRAKLLATLHLYYNRDEILSATHVTRRFRDSLNQSTTRIEEAIRIGREHARSIHNV